MKPINKDALIRNAVITICTSWLTWICLWPSACNDPTPVPNQSENMKAEHVTLVAKYEQKINAYKIKEDSLQRELSETKQKLFTYRKASLQNKKTVEKRIANRPIDTILLVADCDSLRNEVRDYIHSVQQEDSLQQQTIDQQQELIAVKDTAISECNESFNELSRLTEKSISQQQELENRLQKAEKKLKRKAVYNRILAGTTLALVGVTAILITR
jgi:hypothetical protein